MDIRTYLEEKRAVVARYLEAHLPDPRTPQT